MSEMEGSSFSPYSTVFCKDLYTCLGKRSRMTLSEKTLTPKTSVGLVRFKGG